jgi:hypothetical protein
MTEHTNRIARADDRSTPDGLLGSPLTAENLISGYRVDILDTATQQWRSLCQRRVRYSIGDIQVGADTPVLDEGCVRVDSVTADGDDSLYVHQAIARWDGWSLVASRPDRIADPIDIPELPFTVHVSHDPGSLPRLRFGRTYQLRVRLSDTAGGGLHVQEPQLDEQCSAEFIHRRFEPIPPPEMLPTRPYVDGEGQGQLVIRSDRGTSTADYAAAHPAYHPDDLRYLFAPKASLELAIQHGNFDAALGASGAPTADTAFQTAVRADRDIADIVGAQPHGAADDPARYYMVPPTGADLPWLPDPGAPLFAVGVRSRPIDPNTGVEGTASGFDDEHQLHIPHRWGQWPGYAPTGLQLVAGTTGCVASMSGSGTPRTLTIALGPAEQATLDVVSCPAQNDVPALGVALWAGMAANDPADPIFQRVEHGHIRTVTPPHTITVVHAVQRPLVDPAGRFVANRQRDDTDAVLRTTDFTFDVASTGRIDVDATWSDLDDVVTDPPSAPATTTYTTQVGSYDVAHVEADNALPIITQQFGDTRRRRVTHSVTAISRFRDFFGALTAADPDACTVRAVLAPVTDVPSSARAPAPHVRYVVPAFGWSRTRGSDGVFRSTRRGGGLRVLLERPWFASGVEEKLAVIISAGPPGPHVSVAGQDPSWTTSSPQTPLDTTHVVAPGRAPAEPLDEADMSVTPMLYPVAFDDELNCWLADLDLSPLADESYFPFVRLSLCRYQENHIIDVPALSPPVQTEPVQLFPTRNLTVTPTAGHVAAILTGLGPTGARPNNVRAELQIADPGVVSDDAVIGTPGWTTIAASDGSLGQQLQLQLPGSAAGSLRVLVTETENYPSPSPAPNTASGRLIYAEAANLT